MRKPWPAKRERMRLGVGAVKEENVKHRKKRKKRKSKKKK